MLARNQGVEAIRADVANYRQDPEKFATLLEASLATGR